MSNKRFRQPSSIFLNWLKLRCSSPSGEKRRYRNRCSSWQTISGRRAARVISKCISAESQSGTETLVRPRASCREKAKCWCRQIAGQTLSHEWQGELRLTHILLSSQSPTGHVRAPATSCLSSSRRRSSSCHASREQKEAPRTWGGGGGGARPTSLFLFSVFMEVPPGHIPAAHSRKHNSVHLHN